MYDTNECAPIRPVLVPGKKYKYPIIGETRDVEGQWWWVRQIRETKHGFDLLFGTPVAASAPYPTGLPAIIATQPLLDYWEANKTRHDRTIYDVPAGRTTLKRVRHRYGFHVLHDKDEFFREHIDDLRTLPPRQFAAKYNLRAHVAFEARNWYCGPVAREIGWWRQPRVLNILLSRLTRKQKGLKLGIGRSHAGRLSARAAEEQLPLAA